MARAAASPFHRFRCLDDDELIVSSFSRQVQAEDKDWADNSRLEYALLDVSNNGKNKFVVNPETGVIDAVGAVKAGEKYTLTLQVCLPCSFHTGVWTFNPPIVSH